MSVRKRRLIITSLLTLILLLIWTATIGRSLFGINPRDEEGALKTVEHEQYDLSLLYPAEWQASTYGEHGFKGDEATKLQVYPSLLGNLFVIVRYRKAHEPTVEHVVNWSRERIKFLQAGSRERQDGRYEHMFLKEDTLDGHKIIKRRYRLGATLYEEVYIARDDDMITIRFQAGIEQFDNYEEEFESILESFGPLE